MIVKDNCLGFRSPESRREPSIQDPGQPRHDCRIIPYVSSRMGMFWRKNKKEREHHKEEVQKLEWQLQQEKSIRARQENENQEKERQEVENQALKLRREAKIQRLQLELTQRDELEARQEAERLEGERWERERQAIQRQRREERMRKLQIISTKTLRGLRDLIRTRYELDVEIWSLRNVRKPDRIIVLEKMEKADAVLSEILAIVRAWEGTEKSWSKSEWEQAKNIQKRILADGKRRWAGNPPWEEN